MRFCVGFLCGVPIVICFGLCLLGCVSVFVFRLGLLRIVCLLVFVNLV